VIRRIELTDFRVYQHAVIELNKGVTAVIGRNAQGKTSLAEAMSYLSTLQSFRGVPNDALVREGADTAYIRAEIVHDDGREILVQRNTLLKQSFGKLTPEIEMTLDVWDAQLAQKGTQLGEARAKLIARLTPFVCEAYESLAGEPTAVELMYEPEWRKFGLAACLAEARQEDVRRAITSVGPHRDDVILHIKGMSAKNHASQGECRTLALALRLGIHRLVTEVAGTAPLLVLDDVLSELDPNRCEALLRNMPDGQVLITTAQVLPAAAHPDTIIHIAHGTVVPSLDDDGA